MAGGQTIHDTQPGAPRSRGSGGEPFVIVALECESPLRPSSRHSLVGVSEVVIGRGDQRGFRRHQRDGGELLHLSVPSGRMSSIHLRIFRRDNRWMIEDAGSKNGTFVDGQRVELARLPDEALIEAGRTVFLFRASGERMVDTAADLVSDLASDPGRKRDAGGADGDGERDGGGERERDDGSLGTLSSSLRREYDRLARIATSTLPVLLLGETGTGKEVAARALHRLSGRAGSFVAVNCGALAEGIIESELFGHHRGAFSGATENRPGLFRSADRGTIFLDEIAELPLGSQVKLLRVLQESEVRPVGGSLATRIDARVVAATLHDLPTRVSEGAFREDLYARLTGLTVTLPPLRERREDIGLLCGALLRRLAGDQPVRIDRVAARAIFAHHWPFNVRELEHALGAALALAEGSEIQFDNLPERVRAALDAPRPAPAARALDRTLQARLTDLLGEHHGNVSAVARAMGKKPAQIYRWLKRFGLDADDYRR